MSKEELLKKAYVERDISWMYFNHRILQEAEKEYVPLLGGCNLNCVKACS